MKRFRDGDEEPPWGALPLELVQDVFSFLFAHDLASASMTCQAWRAAACGMVTHLTLPLNHPLLVAGPAPAWAELVARTDSQLSAQRRPHVGGPIAGADAAGGNGPAKQGPNGTTPSRPGSSGNGQQEGLGALAGPSTGAGGAGPNTPLTGAGGGMHYAVVASPLAVSPPHGAPLPRLRTQFPMVTHITLIHNAMLHRAQVHAAMSTLRALWPAVRGLSVHDSVTWDLPLDYSALGVMTHITSLELLFQGQGGMDEAGQPLYRASMPHLCRLGQLRELCMKWIIGYDVDSFLDFNEVYDLLASLVRHNQLRSLQFGGENINAEGARHLASITTLETLNLVCDARPASPLHLLDLMSLPRLTRLELMHVCPDHAWNAAPAPGEAARDPLVELSRRTAVLAASPLRCLALSLSPGCQSLVSRALPLLPNLHSLAVRVTTSEEEEALCVAFRAMQAATGPGASPPQAAQQQQQQRPPEAQNTALQLQQRPRLPYAGSPATAAAVAAAAAAAPPPPPQGPPPLRALRLETAELGADLIGCVASLTALTSLQLPRGLPSGELAVYDTAAAEAAAAAGGAAAQPPPGSKYVMSQLSSLGRLTCLRRLMIQMDSPADTAPAFVDGSLVSVLAGLPQLTSLHLSTWNLLGLDPSVEALGAYPERTALLQDSSPSPLQAQSQPSHQQPQHQQQQQPQQQQQAGPSVEAAPSVELGSGRGEGGGGGAAAGETAAEVALEPAGPMADAAAAEGGSGSGGGDGGAGDSGGGNGKATGAEPRRPRQPVPCLPVLPTWAWQGLRSLSLTHWPCVYGKLRESGPVQPGRCYAVRWDDLPRTLEALLLVRCQLVGTRPPARLRHMWLTDCLGFDLPLAQALGHMPELETLVLRSPSAPEEPEVPSEAAARSRAQLVAAVTALRGLRTLGLGGIRCQDVPSLAPLSRLRHLMLEPLQPPRAAHDAPASQRDLLLLDQLMALPPGALAGLRTLWLPNWAMPIKQLLQWQQMLQAAMPLVVLRVTEYDVVWTVPTPIMNVAQVEAPSSLAGGRRAAGVGAAQGQRRPGWSSGRNPLHAGRDLDGQELEWWHIGCWSVL
ncbi:hypothetical protein PLESTB_000173700 [Pleodorina starrii]|uniref:F-box domain-containing protein n=1 Tax=Pleodorina starrii TaxID=330485 RepID=A0A9W6EY96_9CHLO|nr:hypothetical protein PLESTB_000173700 [Pleodorina starrii]GLC66185.1 hypothetical protein PLESTF_000394200 [Pleodorina starrii]